MPDEVTPLFRTVHTSPGRLEDTPRHRREGHFDATDQWHDAAETERVRA